MRRRAFLALLGGAAVAWPVSVIAQPPGEVRRIGVLMAIANDPEGQSRVEAFRQALRELGWTEGGNVRIDVRWGAGDSDRTRVYAAELIGLKPDVILASAPDALVALQQKTHSVPIVFVGVTDAVGAGFVPTLAHPGGQITGFTSYEYAIVGKWLELLREIAPRVVRVALIGDPEYSVWPGYLREITTAASSLHVQVTPIGVHDAAEIQRAIESFARKPDGGLIVLPSALSQAQRELIVAIESRYRVPAVHAFRYFVTIGGLMSYGIDPVVQIRQAATYIDRILKGTPPGELPVQAPTKFELVINLRTARALGLDVPATLLARADEVIE